MGKVSILVHKPQLISWRDTSSRIWQNSMKNCETSALPELWLTVAKIKNKKGEKKGTAKSGDREMTLQNYRSKEGCINIQR